MSVAFSISISIMLLAHFPSTNDPIASPSLWVTVPDLRLHHSMACFSRVGNRITNVQFGHSSGLEDLKRAKLMEDFVDQVRSKSTHVPPEVNVRLRAKNAPNIWNSRRSAGKSLTNVFDDMLFGDTF
ncbi:hypothetical protein CPB84DRAFT_1785439 [Gymnopilus junonius]|uniref:Uncharacterized protein n=1 Tax=Gymnopilus junonius TaxID=109634 RepID=A0A9P5NJ22_GYMJU|nr:hypothetical protein CPB84DRAFT_1785439 [Gymnopilus junonius]